MALRFQLMRTAVKSTRSRRSSHRRHCETLTVAIFAAFVNLYFSGIVAVAVVRSRASTSPSLRVFWSDLNYWDGDWKHVSQFLLLLHLLGAAASDAKSTFISQRCDKLFGLRERVRARACTHVCVRVCVIEGRERELQWHNNRLLIFQDNTQSFWLYSEYLARFLKWVIWWICWNLTLWMYEDRT